MLTHPDNIDSATAMIREGGTVWQSVLVRQDSRMPPLFVAQIIGTWITHVKHKSMDEGDVDMFECLCCQTNFIRNKILVAAFVVAWSDDGEGVSVVTPICKDCASAQHDDQLEQALQHRISDIVDRPIRLIRYSEIKDAPKVMQ